jgi:hypothetical protein
MFPGSNSLAIAVESAKKRDLRPLADDCAEAFDLDQDQLGELEAYLQRAWYLGIRTGHAVMLETKTGQMDPEAVVLEMREEFQDLMEGLADALDTSVGTTLASWNYLGRAWIAGAKFWEVEIAARLIEQRAGDIDEALRRLQE